MIIRCPSCGRDGNAPDSRGRTSQKIRCNPCGARFVIDVSPRIEEPVFSDRLANGAAGLHVRERPTIAMERVSLADDLDLMGFTMGSPSDSQFDMPGVLGGDPDDSQVELPAFASGEEEQSGEIEIAPPFEPQSAEFALAVPWYYKYIESWGRVHFYVAVGFAASSLAVLGFLLVSALVAGRIVSSSITALIVGCLATVALLLLSLSATVLSILVIDLARNMRLLIQQTDRSPAQAHNTKNQSRASLSQPAG
jgi:hypothetical protein